jgi:hypothetical protein
MGRALAWLDRTRGRSDTRIPRTAPPRFLVRSDAKRSWLKGLHAAIATLALSLGDARVLVLGRVPI